MSDDQQSGFAWGLTPGADNSAPPPPAAPKAPEDAQPVAATAVPESLPPFANPQTPLPPAPAFPPAAPAAAAPVPPPLVEPGSAPRQPAPGEPSLGQPASRPGLIDHLPFAASDRPAALFGQPAPAAAPQAGVPPQGVAPQAPAVPPASAPAGMGLPPAIAGVQFGTAASIPFPTPPQPPVPPAPPGPPPAPNPTPPATPEPPTYHGPVLGGPFGGAPTIPIPGATGTPTIDSTPPAAFDPQATQAWVPGLDGGLLPSGPDDQLSAASFLPSVPTELQRTIPPAPPAPVDPFAGLFGASPSPTQPSAPSQPAALPMGAGEEQSGIDLLFGTAAFEAAPTTQQPSAPPFPSGGFGVGSPGPSFASTSTLEVERPARRPLTTSQRTLLAVIGAVVGVLALVVLYLVGTKAAALLGPAHSAPAPVTTDGTVTGPVVGPLAPGTYAWDQLLGGECLDPFTSPWADSQTVVDCTQPHAAQLVLLAPIPADDAASGSTPAPTDGPVAPQAYPGADALATQVQALCTAKGVVDLATAKDYSDVLVQGTYPVTQEQWDAGDHNYACYATRQSGQPFGESIAVVPGAGS